MLNFPYCEQYITHFASHLRYTCQIWSQGRNEYVEPIEKTQNKAIRILNFKVSKEGSENLYKRIKNR